MSRLLHRRLYSTSSTSAPSVAQRFLTETQARPPLTQTQLLDATQLQRFAATLSVWPSPHNHPSLSLARSTPKTGTPLPPAYHLAYFAPFQLEHELGNDGTDTSFNPPSPFTRRMWAGGEVEWLDGKDGGDGGLRVGQTVKEFTRLVSAEGKVTRRGEEMVVVGVEKKYSILGEEGEERGGGLVDRRNWIFRPALDLLNPPPIAPPPSTQQTTPTSGSHTLDLIQTPVTLFRFSALTFNAHKIHYSKEWCREVEGHRNIVVHGPLNLLMMIDFWRATYSSEKIKKIAYRATGPLYAGEPYRIVLDELKDKKTDVRIVDAWGSVGMKGIIESY